MRYRELSEARKRQIRYGALAFAALLLVGGAILLPHHVDRTVATAPPPAGVAPPPAVSASAAAEGDDITVISSLRRDEAVALIADARRQAAAGNFAVAEASLARAEQAVPKLPETQQARDDIARLKTPEGQLADQLQRARLAIDHDDGAAAEAALAEAARLRADAPEIAELRAALQTAHDRQKHREARIAEALARMREAVARRDFGAADSALNEAERIDLQDPSIRRARGELARARGAQRNAGD